MADPGCRPEVADRILWLLLNDCGAGEFLLDFPPRRARPVPPSPEKPAAVRHAKATTAPPKPKPSPKPRAQPKPTSEPKPKLDRKPRCTPAPRPNRLEELTAEREIRRQQARALFAEGKPMGEVAEELGITVPTVATYVSDMRQRRARVATAEELQARREEAARLAREGWTTQEIADKLGRSVSMIKVDLRTCGVRAPRQRDAQARSLPESRSA